MKVLQISASYKPAYIYGGPTLSVSRLCEGLTRSGSEPEVLTTTANGPEELNVEPGKVTIVDGVPVTYFKRLTKDHTHFSPGLLWSLWKKLDKDRESRPNATYNPAPLLHIHAWWNLVSLFSCLIAKLQGVSVVLSPRGTLSNYSFGNRNGGMKSLIHRLLGKPLLKYCHFHVTSEKEKSDILSIIPNPKSITVIPNFVYLPEQVTTPSSLHQAVTTPSPSERAGVRLLFLSRIEEKKGLDILLNALGLLKVNTNCRKISLSIAGSGEPTYVQQLKELSLALGLPVTWLGQQNQQEKWKVMQEHDLLLLPSHDENFANVVIECLATGTPVIVSENVGLADYVEREDLGWICRTTSESVAQVLSTAIEDEQKRLMIRSVAPSKIRRDFNEEVLVCQYVDMYEKITGSSKIRAKKHRG